MKFNTLHLLIALLLGGAVACGPSEAQKEEITSSTGSSTESTFDSLAAVKYGADDYGMKKYVMAFLKKGPNREIDSVRAVQLQNAHMENIVKMAEEGKLVLAGPFFGNGDLRGIYIFNVSSIEEAESLTNTDPAIQEGSLAMELMEWYGSAALMAVNDLHKSVTRKEM